jgi:hypothetical protein
MGVGVSEGKERESRVEWETGKESKAEMKGKRGEEKGGETGESGGEDLQDRRGRKCDVGQGRGLGISTRLQQGAKKDGCLFLPIPASPSLFLFSLLPPPLPPQFPTHFPHSKLFPSSQVALK